MEQEKNQQKRRHGHIEKVKGRGGKCKKSSNCKNEENKLYLIKWHIDSMILKLFDNKKKQNTSEKILPFTNLTFYFTNWL